MQSNTTPLPVLTSDDWFGVAFDEDYFDSAKTHPHRKRKTAFKQAAKTLADTLRDIYPEDPDPCLRLRRTEYRNKVREDAIAAETLSCFKNLKDTELPLSEIIKNLLRTKRGFEPVEKLRVKIFSRYVSPVCDNIRNTHTACKYGICCCYCNETDARILDWMKSECFRDNACNKPYIKHRSWAKQILRHVYRGLLKCVPELRVEIRFRQEDYMMGLGLFIMNKFKASTYAKEFNYFDDFVEFMYRSGEFDAWFTSLFSTDA